MSVLLSPLCFDVCLRAGTSLYKSRCEFSFSSSGTERKGHMSCCQSGNGEVKADFHLAFFSISEVSQEEI